MFINSMLYKFVHSPLAGICFTYVAAAHVPATHTDRSPQMASLGIVVRRKVPRSDRRSEADFRAGLPDNSEPQTPHER